MSRAPAWVGSVVYLLSAQYFVAEWVAAAAWNDPPYSFSDNYISDLGVIGCSDVCSPRHGVMNAGFVMLGVIVATGSFLLIRRLASGGLARAALMLMLVSGAGDILVGLFPGSVDQDVSGSSPFHAIGAFMAIFAGNAGIAILGTAMWRRREHLVLAGYSMASGAVGLVALASFGLDIDLGLGVGAIERVAADPIVIWMVVVGIVTLITQSARRTRT